MLGDAEIGVDHPPRRDLERMLSRQRWEPATAHRPLQSQLMVGTGWTAPRLACGQHAGKVAASLAAATAQAASVRPQRRDGVVPAFDALLEQRFEVGWRQPRCRIEG